MEEPGTRIVEKKKNWKWNRRKTNKLDLNDKIRYPITVGCRNTSYGLNHTKHAACKLYAKSFGNF